MHSHAHSHQEITLDPVRASRAKKILVIITLPILLLTIAGLGYFYPYEKTLAWSKSLFSSEVKQGTALVTDLDAQKCRLPGLDDNQNQQGDRLLPGKYVSPSESGANIAGETTNPTGTERARNSDSAVSSAANSSAGSLLGSAVCARVLSGEGKDSVVPVHIPPESKEAVGVGTVLKIIYDPGIITAGTPFVFWDIARGKALGLLGLIYVVIVVAVAGLRGIRALLGLVGSTLVFMGFVLPALMSGEPPMLVTLVGASAMMFMSVYFAHGISVRTTTALLGTFIGLGITVGLANWGTWASGITGASAEDAPMILGYFPGLSLQALFTCGVVIAGLGALNDVTITQASAVWELNEANPALPKWKLFAHAMQIGRDHIASTVYTLAFAYAGTAMPTLMLAIIIKRSPIELLSVASIAEEVVRTLVASIGLVVAIPATTLVGVLLVKAVGAGAKAVSQAAENNTAAAEKDSDTASGAGGKHSSAPGGEKPAGTKQLQMGRKKHSLTGVEEKAALAGANLKPEPVGNEPARTAEQPARTGEQPDRAGEQLPGQELGEEKMNELSCGFAEEYWGEKK